MRFEKTLGQKSWYHPPALLQHPISLSHLANQLIDCTLMNKDCDNFISCLVTQCHYLTAQNVSDRHGRRLLLASCKVFKDYWYWFQKDGITICFCFFHPLQMSWNEIFRFLFTCLFILKYVGKFRLEIELKFELNLGYLNWKVWSI